MFSLADGSAIGQLRGDIICIKKRKKLLLP